ncbi:ComF family protein [Bacteroidota bacterium]
MHEIQTKSKSYYFIKNLIDSLTDFIAPRYCEICRTYLDANKSRFKFICDKCFDSIPLAPEPEIIFNRFISNFDKDDLAVSDAVSLLSIKEDHDYMNPVYSLKYLGFSGIGTELGRELGRLLEYYNKTDFDALIPVPIHHARHRERGYNQAQFIAKGISDIIKIPVQNKLIKRYRYTQTQTVLSKEERRKNVENAIAPYDKNSDLNGKNYLVIDDVLTTGSTLNACANSLLMLGAKRVEAATIVYV